MGDVNATKVHFERLGQRIGYKEVPLCEHYVRDFLIAAIFPVSVIFVIWRKHRSGNLLFYSRCHFGSKCHALVISRDHS